MYLVIKRFCVLITIIFIAIAILNAVVQPLFPRCVEEKEFVVSRVIDGDTIELIDGIKIRYIGINRKPLASVSLANTPEVNQPGGKEATEANRALVEGEKVRLE